MRVSTKEVNERFKRAVELVASGHSINRACKDTGISVNGYKLRLNRNTPKVRVTDLSAPKTPDTSDMIEFYLGNAKLRMDMASFDKFFQRHQ